MNPPYGKDYHMNTENQNDAQRNDVQTNPSALDTLVQSREIQMLKSIVPYLERSKQRMVCLAIYLAELQKTIRLIDTDSGMQAAQLHISENESPAERTRMMLNAVREYCSPREQESIDLLLSFYDFTTMQETNLF